MEMIYAMNFWLGFVAGGVVVWFAKDWIARFFNRDAA